MSSVTLINKGQISALEPGEISNVSELFEALAFGWKENSGSNRYLVGGIGGDFVRVDPRSFPHPFYNKMPSDIPVVARNHDYRIRGFIQFETQYLYRGMFDIQRGDYGDFYTASLTPAGFLFAQNPVFDVAHLHRGIADCPFFNPKTNDVGADLMLDACLPK